MSESETYDLFLRAREQMKQGLNAQAAVSLEKAKRREPTKKSIREALGIAYFRSRRFADAEREFRALVELEPVDDYAHFALARSLQKQGRADEAKGHLRLAATLRPERRDYRIALQSISA
jgi:Flp pilus assembly protein TadD